MRGERGKSVGARGERVLFVAFERRNLQNSVPLEGLGIAGAVRSKIL